MAHPVSSELRTKVVNVRRENWDVYIGRPHPMIPQDFWTNFGNPFRIGRDGDRREVVEKYRAWLFEKLRTDAELWERIHTQLAGKRLGCFCAPLPCHGDVLAEVADQGMTFLENFAMENRS